MPGIHKKLNNIIFEHNSNKYLSNEIASTILKQCIFDIVRNATLGNGASRSHDKLNSLLKYIQQNYAGNISNTALAAISGYHPYYLNRI